MKTMIALLMLTTVALAEDKPPTFSGSTSAFTINPYPDLVIVCGTGQVKISTKTGNVEFRDGCDPDDAARSFWRAVEQMGVKRARE